MRFYFNLIILIKTILIKIKLPKHSIVMMNKSDRNNKIALSWKI